jgi:anti-sigma factor RsiW
LGVAEKARVATHVAGCPGCRTEQEHFLGLRDMARTVERVDTGGLPEAVRRQIVLQAAQQASSTPWSWRAALMTLDLPVRPAFAAGAAALLVALLALPHAFHESGSPGGAHRVLTIDVVARGGQVRLAWADGHNEAYTVVKSPNPRSFSPREAHRVHGNVWIDEKPDSWPVVFYRIE